MDKEVTDLKKGLEDLEEQKELLLNDIDWFNGELCKKCEYMDNIMKDIDKPSQNCSFSSGFHCRVITGSLMRLY